MRLELLEKVHLTQLISLQTLYTSARLVVLILPVPISAPISIQMKPGRRSEGLCGFLLWELH
ncbi:hypothetical protein RchiOBHm_Chr2g0137611 [Rosa chinensis]|uniref:Uncharacterized protein n=1 Tax=Rosa chinensis TaxID=74649 RepID=A0A2P6RWN6_ROSCH|nr:hypothetical protein RchiOBHm_Chr2g0137611 [Rosa chinensis]